MKLMSPLAALGLLTLLPLFGSCTSAPPFDAAAVAKEWALFMQRGYVLRPGDRLSVSVHPEALVQEIVVPSSGGINLTQVDDEIVATGKSISAFRREVTEAYRKVFAGGITVQVSLLSVSAESVFVTGEVKGTGGGAIPYVPAMTLSQAIAAAGGLDVTAKPSDVRVLRTRGEGAQTTFRVNMEEVLYNGATDFILLPGDVVFCQTSGIADAGNWVHLYIRRLIPIPITTAAF